MERVEVDYGIICVRDVLSATECEALIARAEAVGFEPATINTHSGAKREVSLLTFMIYLNEGYRGGRRRSTTQPTL